MRTPFPSRMKSRCHGVAICGFSASTACSGETREAKKMWIASWSAKQ